jgi:5-methylcytosine-specific restriction endonuclease McrA
MKIFVDRNSSIDAERYFGSLLSIHDVRNIDLANFLINAICIADQIAHENWNLNLSLDGTFIRFNVGQEYCIEIDRSEVLVLCLKKSVPMSLKEGHDSIWFKGYDKGHGLVRSRKFDGVPDALARVPGSIGVVLAGNVHHWVSRLAESNLEFLRYAIEKTSLLPKMRAAHSIGAIEFLSRLTGEKLPNPSFYSHSMRENEIRMERKLKNLSTKILLREATKRKSIPRQIVVSASVYARDPYIAEMAKRNAAGICQDCRSPAPFTSKGTNEPYLEVHHIVPLSEGGEDSIENVIALCPNCHRKRHHG